jgi:uncharacterized hydrophobic protein (TIGR00271 family)
MKNKYIWADIKNKDKYTAIAELIKDSQANANYFSLLILSAIIIAAGVLLANSAILIGGMLITPVLTPILLLALAIVTSNTEAVRRSSLLILKSITIIFLISMIASLLFGIPEDKEFFSVALLNDSIRAAFLYFLVAFTSGIAATFAWIRKEISSLLPGISIAISLVPPIALVGIWLGQGDIFMARFFLVIFLFNLVGIIMSSMIVFSVLHFYKTNDKINEEIETNDKKSE